MLFYDSLHHLIIADDQINPLAFPLPTQDELHHELSSMILSSSGWRKVFAESGDEEDATCEIRNETAMLTALAALALARTLGVPAAQKQAVLGGEAPKQEREATILVGLDARPTGRILGDIACRTLTALGCKVRYLFICAAPQIMADCNLHPDEADAFFYISASHNPIGHNGFKFGKDGGVYSLKEADELTRVYRDILFQESMAPAYLQRLTQEMDIQQYRTVLEQVAFEQQRSLERYETFVLTTAAKSIDSAEHERFRQDLRQAHQKEPLSVIGELNGSARSASIDKHLLTSLGLKVLLLNDRPGEVVHAIVPEGENLELCRTTLQELYAKDSSYRLGYVPDNDGDRGNLVYISEQSGQAQILEAQNVFALVVLAELSQTRLQNPNKLLATVVNCPTSMRIDHIAQAFDAEVFRCEVGESNVVDLARMKREEGYLVPVLGEGSNGGNITHPAKVRDPLNTLLSLVKLLRNRDIAKLWFLSVGKQVPRSITLDGIIESLPVYTTTGSFSKAGKMQVTQSHGILKNRYEALLQSDWEMRKTELSAMGIHSFTIFQTEGTNCYEGMGEAYRHGLYSGGYKVALKNRDGVITDYLWMRGSKTEPVFRVVVDCQGDDENRYEYLLAWHRSMIERADRA